MSTSTYICKDGSHLEILTNEGDNGAASFSIYWTFPHGEWSTVGAIVGEQGEWRDRGQLAHDLHEMRVVYYVALQFASQHEADQPLQFATRRDAEKAVIAANHALSALAHADADIALLYATPEPTEPTAPEPSYVWRIKSGKTYFSVANDGFRSPHEYDFACTNFRNRKLAAISLDRVRRMRPDTDAKLVRIRITPTWVTVALHGSRVGV